MDSIHREHGFKIYRESHDLGEEDADDLVRDFRDEYQGEYDDEGIAMADSDVNLNMNNCDDGCATFDVQRFLRGLDAIIKRIMYPMERFW